VGGAPSGLVWSGEVTLWGDVETPFLSGDGIKVTKGAWQVPKWLAFVPSQVVVLRETW
jgi:hypothetical protein